MKKVPIHEIKGHLSEVVAEAESGQTILITRHNRPVARLGPAGPLHTHAGKSHRGATLRPLLKQGTRGRYLSVLLDDRRGRLEG
jgi:prevent-host-death family protein